MTFYIHIINIITVSLKANNLINLSLVFEEKIRKYIYNTRVSLYSKTKSFGKV